MINKCKIVNNAIIKKMSFFINSLAVLNLPLTWKLHILLKKIFANFFQINFRKNHKTRGQNNLLISQKMKFSIKYFFSKCDQICRNLRIWSHLLTKSSMENFVFRAVRKLLQPPPLVGTGLIFAVFLPYLHWFILIRRLGQGHARDM